MSPSSSPPTASPPHPQARAQSINLHAPITPSALRESHTLSSPEGSPEFVRPTPIEGDDEEAAGEGAVGGSPSSRGKWVKIGGEEYGEEILGAAGGASENGKRREGDSSETSSLLGPRGGRDTPPSFLRRPLEALGSIFSTKEPAHPGPCDHGGYSPTLDYGRSREGSIASTSVEYGTFVGRPAGPGRTGYSGSPEGSNGKAVVGNEGAATEAGSILSGKGSVGESTRRMLKKRGKTMRTTNWLAERHGITNLRLKFLAYYIPFIAWIPQYRWSFLRGDFAAAITMASFYLPMALSYASNLSHLPPINGLYAFAFQPLIYAFLGSCPQMVVGPEAAGSLLVGSVVRSQINKGHAGDEDSSENARVAGVVTGLAGAAIFAAGLARLGFLDSVLSKPFLRGFISAIGFVIIVDQLIPEMGLAGVAEKVAGVAHGSSITKLGFLVQYVKEAHGLTCAVAGISFVVIMSFRELKKRLQPRFPNVAYFPDRFLVVVCSAILCHSYRWDLRGLEILGEVKSASGHPFSFHWPFRLDQMHHIQEAMSTSFLIALLGFFESSVAAKSIGGAEVVKIRQRGEEEVGEDEPQGIVGVALSPNRELVALGVANLVGGCFCALPAFGGYGRSKVNASTGGRTPMSSILLSGFTVICVLFLLPYFYYLPKAVLSSMITVVAYSLLEESPHDIRFFLRIQSYASLTLMLSIFLTTIFYSLSLGIATGIGLSLLSVIKHATRPRIQILGRIPGTNRFVNAEDTLVAAQNHPSGEAVLDLEFIEGCLIIKIPEPLTFANTGELKSRLRRLEIYGTNYAHPALPPLVAGNRNVIFDIHGVTELDGAATQVLSEIVQGYREKGVRVYFCRGPGEGTAMWGLFERSGILEGVGGRWHFLGGVDEALRLMEVEGREVDGAV